MNDLKIELYFENDNQERFDIIRNGVSLKMGEFIRKSEYDYKQYSFQNKLKTVKESAFKPKEISFEMSVQNEQVYQNFISFLNKQPKGLKLYYSNYQNQKELFCFLDVEKIEALQVKRSDQYTLTLSSKIVSPWFKLKDINFSTTENVYHAWYGGEYPLTYSSPPARSYGTITVTNNGHSPSPFIIICEAGGTDLKWTLLDSSNNVVTDLETGAELSGQVSYTGDDQIIIDNFNNRITTGNVDISYTRNRYLTSFFNIPVGEYILKIEGTNSGIRGVLYESYEQI